MPLDFPNSPTNGQTYTGPNNLVWQWDGTKWIAGFGAASAYAPVTSPQFLGDPTAPTAAPGDADASIATTAFVAAAVAPDRNNVGRNLIHNGLFNVQQRGTGTWSANGYTADRWFQSNFSDTVLSAINPMSDGNRAQIGDEAATYFFQHNFTGTAVAAALNDIEQPIEDIRRLAGKTVTVSFWATANAAGTKLGLNIWLQYGTGGSPSANAWAQTTGVAVTLTASWARYTATLTIPSIAGKTLGTNGNSASVLCIGYSSGASNNAAYGNIGVQSGTVYLWGVQLEVGTVATPLEKPDPQVDLANCQRFYQVVDNIALLSCGAGAYAGGVTSIPFPVQMRAGPTWTTYGVTGNATGGISAAVSHRVAGFSFGAGNPLGNYYSFSATFSADL